ncbi:MAG TPA: alpha/beta fold hydrolase [Thermoanaerobaculia bacterium]|jgi:triacylglycerol lipase|nr:alpha/beta fold hydrolase [Thermoanaerobaculia bacterium]
MGHTIVLAHGVLGFGDRSGPWNPIHYFNGVKKYLEGLGHRVLVPEVSATGTIIDRGNDLASQILRAVSKDEKVHIIAHSMGGLDARHAITNVFKSPKPVATLITIGTPHRGSPVADAIETNTGPLVALIPPFILAALELRKNAGALHDLTTAGGREFDARTPDVEHVRYIQVAGNAARGGKELILFKLADAIADLKGEINDGVVTRSSALRLPDLSIGPEEHENLDDWPGDHAAEVGWTLPSFGSVLSRVLFQTPPHLKRYKELVAMLKP